jgi:hypothetical protein
MPALIAVILSVLAGGLVVFGAPPEAILLMGTVWGALLWLRGRFANHHPTACA